MNIKHFLHDRHQFMLTVTEGLYSYTTRQVSLDL